MGMGIITTTEEAQQVRGIEFAVAPSTSLRLVPLPRFAGEDQSTAGARRDLSLLLHRVAGEGDRASQMRGGGGVQLAKLDDVARPRRLLGG